MTLIANSTKYVNETEVKIKCEINTRTSPCQYSPGVRLRTLEDVKRPFLHFQHIDLTNNKTVFDQVIILCLFDSSSMDVFMKMILDQIRKSMDFSLVCPIKKGIIQFYPYKQNYGVLLNFISLNQPQRHIAILKNRFSKKKLETFLTYSVDFEIVEN